MAETSRMPIGTVVVLKSGGPPMTLGGFYSNGDRFCQWFDRNGHVLIGRFADSQLVAREPPKDPDFA